MKTQIETRPSHQRQKIQFLLLLKHTPTPTPLRTFQAGNLIHNPLCTQGTPHSHDVRTSWGTQVQGAAALTCDYSQTNLYSSSRLRPQPTIYSSTSMYMSMYIWETRSFLLHISQEWPELQQFPSLSISLRASKVQLQSQGSWSAIWMSKSILCGHSLSTCYAYVCTCTEVCRGAERLRLIMDCQQGEPQVRTVCHTAVAAWSYR